MPRKTLTDSATAVETNELPRWDLSALFPGLDSPEFAERFGRLLSGIDDLAALFDEVGVSAAAGRTKTVPLADFERVLNALNDVANRLESMGSYLYGCISTDSRNELAQARYSQFQERAVALDKLQTRFTRGWEPCPLRACRALDNRGGARIPVASAPCGGPASHE